MSLSKLLEDTALRPRIFVWWGGMSRAALVSWSRERGYRTPEPLLDLWERLGGGDLFESETILAPLAEPAAGDDVDSVRDLHLRNGMSVDWVPFHQGLELSVFHRHTGEIAVLKRHSYGVQATFADLASWYTGYLRPLFAQRYGLPSD